ncbi:non-ribosomal peptide synthetase [Candidatus Uabimicrobium amorphum]|uniref:Non-ribosomal peptide synthetase n=1 Tax=Uabimicrobium amorphum TaxID=2596890 RepID=A0A5S9F5G1_UABAM|nr:non-ribosomal peptide synthetase [Candidatus Uabimicrobium amorphum]BBM85629.1 non-ribosomal peptide synthetase [Candidatus Uabimicrobium amorphum]
MMKLDDLLSYLQRHNIQLSTKGQKIHVRAPKNTITPQISQAIAQHRSELLMHLHQQQLHKSSRRNPLQKITSSQKIPLSLNQQRLWLIHQIYQEKDPYNVPQALEIFGHLNTMILEKSLTHIVLRHEILRTVFYEDEGIPYQKILAPYEVTLPCTSISQEISHNEKIEKITHEESYTNFDLEKGMVRFRLLQLDKQHHVLFIVLHHCICDGSSFTILQRELIKCYDAYMNRHQPQLSNLPIQYSDFALWQRKWIDDETVKLLLDYWKTKLQGLQPLPLVTDYLRPSQPTFKGNSIHFNVKAQLLTKFKTLLREHNCTLFMGLLAIYKILLSRYSREQDIVVGFPIACRNHPALQNLIGFVVNTVALHTKLNDEYNFGEVLQVIRQGCLETQAYQDMPFEKLVENLSIDRDPSRFAIFQNSFALQQNWLTKTHISDITFQPLRLKRLRSRFDFHLMFEEVDEQLLGCWEYSVDLFEQATIERMATHFVQLLQSAVESPQHPIAHLDMLTSEEKQRLLVEFNDTQHNFPKNTVHGLFETQARKTPKNVALVCKNKQITYRELDEKASQLAYILAQKHRPIIAIIVERSIEMVIGILAILKSGAAYLPIDPNYPQQRIDYMLQDANIDVLLTSKNVKAIQANTVIYVDDNQISQEKLTESSVSPYNLFNIVYTSGSTGKPKGIQVKHNSVANLLLHFQRQMGITTQDTLLSVTTVCFDISVLEIFLPLISGAKNIIATTEEVTNVSTLKQKASSVTIMQATPSLWTSLLDDGWKGNSHLKILCGGEELNQNLASELLQKCRALWNVYGPTETTIWSTSCRVKSSQIVTIGKPIANTQLYVMQKNRLCAIGVPGELCISGWGVAQGYLNRPQLTQNKFVDNPYQAGRKMYKTGDLVRWLPNGEIQFLGRIDDQIKVRGFRMEPGEVETTLRQHPDITHALVVAQKDQHHHQILVAYIVAPQSTSSQLRLWLQSKLPQYMIPTHFVVLDKFPLTPNNKIDRQALPQNFITTAKTYVLPKNPMEEQIHKIWQKVLKINNISTNDNFFELGGHSLLAIRMISQVRETFQQDIPLQSIFLAPTIQRFAQLLETSTEKLTPIVALAKDKYPLSAAQKRLWFLYLLEPQSTFYNMSRIVDLKGEVDIPLMEKAITLLGERQHALKTYLEESNDGEVWQKISSQKIPLDVANLADKTNTEEQIKHEVEKEKNPFVLTKFPLVRFKLICCGKKRFVLCITMHHIISDHWSMGVLWKELTEIYNALQETRTPQLQILQVQYGDFCVWQRQQNAIAKQRDYWQKQFATKPTVLDLPTDYPRPAQQNYRGERCNLVVDENLKRKLDILSHQNDSTLFMVLLTAFNILLHRYSGQEDITIGFPIANRHHGKIENNIGFFINTLALRTDLSGDPSFEELLRRVKEVCLGAYAHQEYPFEQLVEDVNPVRDMSRNPIFQVMVNMLDDAKLSGSEFIGLQTSNYKRKMDTTKFDLTLYIRQQDALQITFRYSRDLFSLATIERMTRHFLQLLNSIVRHPQQKIAQLQIFGQYEQQQYQKNRAQQLLSVPETKEFITFAKKQIQQSIFQRYTQKVNQHGSHHAVFSNHEYHTYQEIYALSCHLALQLQQCLGENTAQVALLFSHNLSMIAAILGVVAAGKTYVPLEPVFSQRQQFIVEDANVRAIVTETNHLPQAQLLANNDTVVFNFDNLTIQDNNVTINHKVSPDHIAYLLYTSGSTGTPKGVVQNHRNILHFIRNYTNNLKITHTDRLLMVAGYHFDASIMDIFAALLNGATLYLFDLRNDSIEDLATWIIDNKITIYHSTPTIYRHFVKTIQEHQHFPDLRFVVLGGEEVRKEDVDSYKKHFEEHCIFVNGLGPTESTVTLQNFIYHHTPIPQNTVAVGYPVEDTDIVLLDAQQRPTELYGEIAIKSPHVALEYWRRPQLNAQTFLNNSPNKEKRTYRTGDMGYMRADGQIMFMGRKDSQVKIRGIRVELGEIEITIREHPKVVETAVVHYQHNAKSFLVSYVVTNTSLCVDEIKNFVREKLPSYMVPSHFVLREALPLNASGKIDKKALAEIENFDFTATKSAAPRNDIEKKLCDIWQDILQVKNIGIHDDFFALGGHSLLAVHAVSQMRPLFGFASDDHEKLPLSVLLTHPTIHDFVTIVPQIHTTLQQSIIPMNAKLRGHGIFLVHAANVDPICYQHLSHCLDGKKTAYAIRTHDLPADTSIEDTARYHCEKIKTIQAHGPYVIGGMCLGGIVAFELARQLQQRGDAVKLVFMMDTINIPGMENYKSQQLHQDKKRRKKKRLQKLVKFWQHVCSGDMHFVAQKIKKIMCGLSIKRKIKKLTDPRTKLRKKMRAQLRTIRDRYKPQPYNGVLVYIRSEKQQGDYAEKRLRQVAPNVKVHKLPGTIHSDVTRSYFAEKTSEIVQDYLGRVID